MPRSICRLALGLAVFLCVPVAHAVEQSVTINPLGFLGQGPWAQWERATRDSQSYTLRAGVMMRGPEEWQANGFGLGASYNLYLLGKAPTGLFVNVGLDFNGVRIAARDNYLQWGDHQYGLLLTPSAMLGYNFVFGPGITVGAAVGGNYGVPIFRRIALAAAQAQGSLRPLYALNVGYSW